MNINDISVLDKLNEMIATNRLNKVQILKMVNLVSLSKDMNDLKDNLKWESSNSFQNHLCMAETSGAPSVDVTSPARCVFFM